MKDKIINQISDTERELFDINTIEKYPLTRHSETVALNRVQDWIDRQSKYVEVDLQPDFQRGLVWKDAQKTAFLEYIFRGGRTGLEIIWNCPNYINNYLECDFEPKMELLDGQQRINAVLDFLNNNVKVFGYLAKEIKQTRFDVNFTFKVVEIASRKQLVETYIQMAIGGNYHTIQDLKTAYQALDKLK